MEKSSFKCDLYYGALGHIFDRDNYPPQDYLDRDGRSVKRLEIGTRRFLAMGILSLIMKRLKQRYQKYKKVSMICTTGFIKNALGLSESTVKRILRELKDMKYIDWEVRPDKGKMVPLRRLWISNKELLTIMYAKKPERQSDVINFR